MTGRKCHCSQIMGNAAGDASSEVYSCMKASFSFEIEGNEEERKVGKKVYKICQL